MSSEPRKRTGIFIAIIGISMFGVVYILDLVLTQDTISAFRDDPQLMITLIIVQIVGIILIGIGGFIQTRLNARNQTR